MGVNKKRDSFEHFKYLDDGEDKVALVDKKADAMLEMNWYMTQMDLIGQGKQPAPGYQFEAFKQAEKIFVHNRTLKS